MVQRVMRKGMARLAGLVMLALVCASCGLAGGPGGEDASSPPQLIPRADLFGNPERAQTQLSPDGRYISFLAPREGYLNVWVAPAQNLSLARPVTADAQRGVRWHAWSPSGRILYMQDKGGDENWALHVIDLQTGSDRILTPSEGVRAEIVSLSPRDPGAALITLNDRDPAWRDVYRLDLATGERTLVFENDRRFAEFWADRDNRLRLAAKALATGAVEFWSRDMAGEWSLLTTAPFEDAQLSRPIGFEGDGRSFLMFDSVGRDRAALMRVDAATAEKTVIAESRFADVSDVWIHPAEFTPQAFGAEYLKQDWQAISPDAKADIDFLNERLEGEPKLASRTLDDRRWIVLEHGPTVPARVHLYDREERTLRYLFSQRPALRDAPLQSMIPIEIKARDGLTLVSYLTLPPGSDADGNGRPEAATPLVLLVHGGPWARDSYGFRPDHQWLANRGYAVLSVNFRGSTGFGKAFVNAGNREWGGRMQQDLADAVNWAVQEGVAARDKVAIYGGSYGGYAALAGLAFTPETYACGVSVVGPSNLETLLGSVPPYWKGYFEDLALRVGDPRTPAGRRLLRAHSPLTKAADIRRPLLIAQGGNDPRVKRAESDQIVAAMREQDLPVTYLFFPDEGHGFARPQNRMAFYAAAEGFLAQCLGGRAEPIAGALEGSSVEVLEGAALIPGLEAALEGRSQ